MHPADVFKTMVMMTVADGKVTPEELRLLLDRAAAWGITVEEASEAINNVLEEESEIAIPASKPECYRLLRQMVVMMSADGELAPAEADLLNAAAEAMGLTREELNQFIQAL